MAATDAIADNKVYNGGEPDPDNTEGTTMCDACELRGKKQYRQRVEKHTEEVEVYDDDVFYRQVRVEKCPACGDRKALVSSAVVPREVAVERGIIDD